MTWVLASVPFWLAGGFLVMMVAAAWVYAFSPAGMREPREVWNHTMLVSIMFLCIAGLLLSIAAKIAS